MRFDECPNLLDDLRVLLRNVELPPVQFLDRVPVAPPLTHSNEFFGAKQRSVGHGVGEEEEEGMIRKRPSGAMS